MTASSNLVLVFVLLLLHIALAWVNHGAQLRLHNIPRQFQRFASAGEDFLSTFSGDFDNYQQVVKDRQNGLLPREGGGHEHIHCILVPVAINTRLAAFYFDGNPMKIFRFRFYEILDDGVMKLYTLSPDLEVNLRREAEPTNWPQIYDEYNSGDSSHIQELSNCDVQWSQVPDPCQHDYALKAYPDRPGNHAIMIHGEATVESTMMPGVKILVRDQLSLWDDEFWIHDRGFDPATMTFIYGNQLGVPYQLQRVTRMKEGKRVVCRSDLKWTLGSDWRTEEEYQRKLQAINGVSSKTNA
jgi:CpeT/CpcT family (DUF1001)